MDLLPETYLPIAYHPFLVGLHDSPAYFFPIDWHRLLFDEE